MISFQRIGGLSALVAAATYLVGFWLYFQLLEPAQYGSSLLPPLQHAGFLAENEALLRGWNFIIYIVNGVVLTVLAIAVHRRLAGAPTGLALCATAFGLMWATLVLASGMVANVSLGVITGLYETEPVQAAGAWLVLTTVQEGLGGGNELVGGLWILLVSAAAQCARCLPTWLNLLGVTIGLAGLLTLVPGLTDAGAVFGLGMIAWFIAVGFALLFGRRPEVSVASR